MVFQLFGHLALNGLMLSNIEHHYNRRAMQQQAALASSCRTGTVLVTEQRRGFGDNAYLQETRHSKQTLLYVTTQVVKRYINKPIHILQTMQTGEESWPAIDLSHSKHLFSTMNKQTPL